MKKIYFLFIALFVVYISFAQNTGSNLDTLISTYAKLYKFNGAAFVAKGGNILLNKGYGYRNANDKVLNSEETIF